MTNDTPLKNGQTWAELEAIEREHFGDPDKRTGVYSDRWTSTQLQRPEEGVVVWTKIDDKDGCRNEQKLKRKGNLWWHPDGSMYVYYSPTHWKPV